MSLKNEVINGIIAVEGGYVNDPSDSGGETNFGITKRVARACNYQGAMVDMPKQAAYDIYSKKYWDALCLDDVCCVSEKIAEELADTGVNMGVGRAGEFFQRSLNVLNNQGKIYADIKVDGDIGAKTIAAFKAFMWKRGENGERVLYDMLNCLQGAFYVTLAERRQKDERFIFGWFLNRIK